MEKHAGRRLLLPGAALPDTVKKIRHCFLHGKTVHQMTGDYGNGEDSSELQPDGKPRSLPWVRNILHTAEKPSMNLLLTGIRI